ncbi:hypothetical protein ACIOTI_10205 [Streptomyces sp. NPDC087843]|uniref:hypothetical protein n=1 Tax=Streptomyces sp. NPDC087843 TaxID=3365804 RepID=UPI0038097513
MPIDTGDVCGKASGDDRRSTGHRSTDRRSTGHGLTDRQEREMQRRAEERMPGVSLGEWLRRLAAGAGAGAGVGRGGLGLPWRPRGRA